jgi:hypothetical protein
MSTRPTSSVTVTPGQPAPPSRLNFDPATPHLLKIEAAEFTGPLTFQAAPGQRPAGRLKVQSPADYHLKIQAVIGQFCARMTSSDRQRARPGAAAVLQRTESSAGCRRLNPEGAIGRRPAQCRLPTPLRSYL